MKRTRGGTFTIIVLLASALLLTIGGAFVDASRNLIHIGGMRERHEQAKEAIAGAATWARAAVAAGTMGGDSRLELSRCEVLVTLKPDGHDVAMEASVKTSDGTVKGRALLSTRGEKWVIARFELDEPR